MSRHPLHLAHGARLAELWSLRARDELSPAEAAELDRLEHDASTRAHAARFIDALELAMINDDAPAPGASTPDQAMPPGLRKTLQRQAHGHFEATPSGRSATPDRSSGVVGRIGPAGVLGWVAAAAAMVLAAIAWWPPARAPESPGAIARAQAIQIDRAADAVRLAFKPASDAVDPEFKAAVATVVWSDAQQRGYMRITGLQPNDPATRQFQLWIVDPSRDQRPVDGGVFDITSSGEVIIPFTARLPVNKPAAFAITGEQPGGVVVSGGPMLLVASRS